MSGFRRGVFGLTCGVLSLMASAACSDDASEGFQPSSTDPTASAGADGGSARRDGGGSATPLADASAKDGAMDGAPSPLPQPCLDTSTASSRQRQVPKSSATAPPNGYVEYLPRCYSAQKPVPLMVFWHGLGENGSGEANELGKVLANGPPKLIAANKWADDRPFIVLSPQHSGGGCPGADEIDLFITFATSHYAIDAKRIYLTGLSCGAIGSWQYIAKYKDKAVAATLLISGDPGGAWQAAGCSLVSKLALWSVHGDQDPTVGFQGDNDTMQKLLACPQPRTDVRWNPVTGGGHDAWTTTYDLSAGRGDVYAWMLANAKP
ncbi:MAG: hypothetical protein U0174_15675 [Polyangiaceae bacterium]